MSRYSDFIKELDKVLEEKKAISTDRYGLVAKEGKEADWDAMEKRAEEIRKEMRVARYGNA